ncbi:hypothetical protein ALI144C_08010 [Actinosynnema sp. ALI-1.44]|uniref:toll/interleukin-1 receptor domain-containing protein n=1 Tax=Actinosynnema sp. ALI-1.44 TaxID=1933779 RepID=UPI00097C46AF|nr:toll/interleukin-1 receptor domain-containing protein [Actinosynnema sp. ALI-1.44]ONI87872.1 hypothetical protein ALI144C_08010 [Actinosynnema sp. ALI-1.44]
MGGVFINYRTGDGDWVATLLARELSARIGSANVFFASRSIGVGQDFVTQILGRLRECEVMLAVIGARWLDATDRHGSRRLSNPADWVRKEIAEAFRHGLRVIPVFLDTTASPATADLPDDLGALASCPALRLRHGDDGDLARLLDEVVALARQPPSEDTIHRVASQTLAELDESRYPVSVPRPPDSEAPAALEDRLARYARDMTRLLRLTATGGYLGGGPHKQWIGVLDRFLNRRDEAPPADGCRPWLAAELYPALLLSYTIGISGIAAGHDDLAYRQLALAKAHGPTQKERSALRVLALRLVVDPQYATAFPKWRGTRHHHALSVHLRQELHPIFHHLVGDRAYELAFEEYEYLRSLLELHSMAFTSLGEFAFHQDQGTTTVAERMSTRLTSDSVLLRAGAFDGDAAKAAAARHQLAVAIRGRYR